MDSTNPVYSSNVLFCSIHVNVFRDVAIRKNYETVKYPIGDKHLRNHLIAEVASAKKPKYHYEETTQKNLNILSRHRFHFFDGKSKRTNTLQATYTNLFKKIYDKRCFIYKSESASIDELVHTKESIPTYPEIIYITNVLRKSKFKEIDVDGESLSTDYNEDALNLDTATKIYFNNNTYQQLVDGQNFKMNYRDCLISSDHSNHNTQCAHLTYKFLHIPYDELEHHTCNLLNFVIDSPDEAWLIFIQIINTAIEFHRHNLLWPCRNSIYDWTIFAGTDPSYSLLNTNGYAYTGNIINFISDMFILWRILYQCTTYGVERKPNTYDLSKAKLSYSPHKCLLPCETLNIYYQLFGCSQTMHTLLCGMPSKKSSKRKFSDSRYLDDNETESYSGEDVNFQTYKSTKLAISDFEMYVKFINNLKQEQILNLGVCNMYLEDHLEQLEYINKDLKSLIERD